MFFISSCHVWCLATHQSIRPNVPFFKIFLGKAWVPSIPWRFRRPPEVSNGAMHLTYITADSPPGGLVSWNLYFKARVIEIFWMWGQWNVHQFSVAFFCIRTRYQAIASSMEESRTTCMRQHNIQLLHISLLEQHTNANSLPALVLVMAFQDSISIKTIQETITIISCYLYNLLPATTTNSRAEFTSSSPPPK